MYYRTTDYFDEDFVQSDDFLQYWPADVKIEDIKEVTNEGVDAEAWMARWEAIVSARELRNSPGNCPGSKRSDGPKRRCTRSVDEDFDFDDDDDFTDFDGVRVFTGNDTLLERYAAAEAEIKLPPTDLMVRDPNYYVKRNPIAIIIEIIFFAARLGTSLLARTASALSRYAPRLAGLAKNTDRLFKVAPKGSGTPRGIDGMKNAMTRIVNNKSFRQCVAEGVPL
jgi:hypothetical protein